MTPEVHQCRALTKHDQRCKKDATHQHGPYALCQLHYHAAIIQSKRKREARTGAHHH